MADGLTTQSSTLATVPASSKIATDDAGAAGHVQVVKLAVSTDGSATALTADADGMLVNLGTNNDVSVTGTVTVDGSGVTQPVSDAGGSLTVDNAALSVTGGGVEATALRVTLASDSTGVVSVDDNGGSLTVDGTVTANAGTGTFTVDGSGVTQPVSASALPLPSGASTAANQSTANGLLTTIDADTGAIAAAVAAEGAALGSGVLLQGDDGTDRKNINVDATTGDVQVDVTNTVTVDGSGVTQPVSNAGLTELAAAINSSRVDVNIAADGVGIGGGTQYAVDTAAGGTDTGTMALAVRDDSLTTLTPVDGDYVPLRVNSTGALHVTGAGGGTQYNVDDAGPTVVTMAGVVRDDSLTTLTEVDGDATVLRVSSTGALHVTGGGGGTEYTDDTSTHATGSSVGNLMMAAATPTDGSVDANDIGAVAMSTDRRLHVDAQLVGQDADITIADGGNSITVDGTVTANLSATDNAVLDQIEVNTSYGDSVGGGTEAAALRVTVASDSTGVLSVDDNGGSLTVDNAALSVTGGGTQSGALRVTLASDSTGVVSIDDNGGSLTVDGTVTASNTAGNVAHDSADSGNPVKVGFKAYNMDGTAPGTAVAEADRANGISDVYGRQFVETAHPNLWQAMGLYSTAQTDTSVKAAPGAGLSLYITDIVVSTDTAFNCFFEQGTTKVYGTLYLAANGGASSHFRTPIKLPANTALTFTSSTTANHSITVNGYTAA